MKLAAKVTSASVIFLGSALGSPLATAGTLQIERQDGAKRLIVRSEDTGSSAILTELARDYGFSIRLPAKLKAETPPSRTLRGDLRTVLGRLLSEESYYIQNDPDAPAGIGKVVVLGTAAPVNATGETKPRAKKRRLSWSRNVGGAAAKRQKAKN